MPARCERNTNALAPLAASRQRLLDAKAPVNLMDVTGCESSAGAAGEHPATSDPKGKVAGARWTSSVGGAAPDGSLRRDGREDPIRRHSSTRDGVKDRARIRRASQTSDHDAIVGAWSRRTPGRLR